MPAGMNVLFRVWRMTEQPGDDYVGGASISGSVIYHSVRGVIQSDEETQVFLEQGLEINQTYSANVIPGTLDIRERDELQLIAPQDHPEYGHRFRVVSSPMINHNPRDPRNYKRLRLTRSVRAHAQQ